MKVEVEVVGWYTDRSEVTENVNLVATFRQSHAQFGRHHSAAAESRITDDA